MKKKSIVSFNETSNALLKNPKVAALYLEECLASGDIDLFKLVLKDVAAAYPGGMTKLSRATELTREALYRSLSKKGNPRLDTLAKVLDVFGLRIGVSVKKSLSSDVHIR